MPAQLGESVTLVFDFTVAGVPTSGLSPAPVITIYSPAGVALVSAASMTEQVTPARYIYTYTLPNVAGLYEARAFSSQANLDSQYMSCGLEVGQAWIQDLDATISSRTKPADTQAAVTLVTTTTNLTNAPTNGDFTTTMKTSLNAATPASVTTVTGNINGNVTGSVGSVVGSVGSVAGNVVGSVGSLATQAKSDVNAEVVDALTVDTYAEPSAPPAATASIADKIGWTEVMARNKLSETNALQTVYADDDSTVIATAVITDNGSTTVREKMT